MDINLNELPYVVYACFVLHNFCEIHGERIGEDKVTASMDYDKTFKLLNQLTALEQIVMKQKVRRLEN